MTQRQADEGLAIVTTTPIEGRVVLSLRGDLDVATVDLLKAEAQPLVEAGRRIVLDVAGVSFCDSAGLGGIITLFREADAVDATLALAAPDARLSELLRITGLDGVVPVTTTVDEALQ